ncbi:hypothetical protein SLA2020_459820 [Shorea laevis]
MIANTEPNSNWNWLWKVKTLPKISFFIWLLAHNSIPTRATLATRGLQIPNTCPRCSSPETPIHALSDCPFILSFWQCTHFLDTLQSSFSLSLLDWIKINCSSKLFFSSPTLPWSSVCCFLLWHIWLDRNQLCFRNTSHIGSIRHKSLSLATEFWSSRNHIVKRISSDFIAIYWTKPPMNFIKINTDGSTLRNPGPSGAGGVLRDDSGSWIVGYALNLGIGTNTNAEFWGIKQGLELALERGFKRIILESDSLFAVNSLNNQHSCRVHLPLFVSCRSLLSLFDEV